MNVFQAIPLRINGLAEFIPSDAKYGEGGYDYYGFLALDGSWYIARHTITNDEFRYFRGADNYKTATTGGWAKRTTHSYGYFNEIFGP